MNIYLTGLPNLEESDGFRAQLKALGHKVLSTQHTAVEFCATPYDREGARIAAVRAANAEGAHLVVPTTYNAEEGAEWELTRAEVFEARALQMPITWLEQLLPVA